MSDPAMTHATTHPATLSLPLSGRGIIERCSAVLNTNRLNIASIIGLALLLAVVVMAIFAPWLAPHSYIEQDIEHRLAPPAWMDGGDPSFPLGTDHLGRDILSRIIYGSRISLLVGVSAVVIAGTVGVTLGLLAGYFRGVTETVIMRLADIQSAFPFLLLIIAVIAVLGPGLTNMILVMGLSGWVSYARLVRSEVLAVREREYAEAAVVMGLPDRRIILQHILPNVAGSIVIMAAMEVGKVILFESSLSFLGLGVQPPIPTWGGMMADGRQYLSTHWWVATIPGLAIMMTTMGTNLVGDWLRERLDPRAKDS
ncbi:MAG: ABC transporter permease [Bacillota bacterium]